MNRKLAVAGVVMLLMFSVACSMNRQTPKQWDDTAIEADVRAKVAEVVTDKTFGIEVKVDHGVVTLNGHVRSEDDRRKIGHAVDHVNGVRTVVNNLTIE